jgi:hypothetical protein
MSGVVKVTTRTPVDLTILRDKVARGERVTQAECLRMQELERWLGWRIGQELNEVPTDDHFPMP